MFGVFVIAAEDVPILSAGALSRPSSCRLFFGDLRRMFLAFASIGGDLALSLQECGAMGLMFGGSRGGAITATSAK